MMKRWVFYQFPEPSFFMPACQFKVLRMSVLLTSFSDHLFTWMKLVDAVILNISATKARTRKVVFAIVHKFSYI